MVFQQKPLRIYKPISFANWLIRQWSSRPVVTNGKSCKFQGEVVINLCGSQKVENERFNVSGKYLPWYKSDTNIMNCMRLMWYIFCLTFCFLNSKVYSLRKQPTSWNNHHWFASETTSWETGVEIPYWQCLTTQIWVVPLFGWSKFPTGHDQSEALPKSRVWSICAHFWDISLWENQ